MCQTVNCIHTYSLLTTLFVCPHTSLHIGTTLYKEIEELRKTINKIVHVLHQFISVLQQIILKLQPLFKSFTTQTHTNTVQQTQCYTNV